MNLCLREIGNNAQFFRFQIGQNYRVDESSQFCLYLTTENEYAIVCYCKAGINYPLTLTSKVG